MVFRPEKHSVPWSHQTGKTIRTCSAHLARANEGLWVDHMSTVLSRAVLNTQSTFSSFPKVTALLHYLVSGISSLCYCSWFYLYTFLLLVILSSFLSFLFLSFFFFLFLAFSPFNYMQLVFLSFPSSASHWHVTGLCRCSSSFSLLVAQSFHHPGGLCGSSLNSLQSLWWGGAQKQMSHSRWFHLQAQTERLLLYLAVMWCDYLAFNGADLSWLFSLCVLGLDCGHCLWLLKETF